MAESENLDKNMEDTTDGNLGSKPEKKMKRKLKGALTFECTDRISQGSPLDEAYDMSSENKGKCIIFNHEIFSCGLGERYGTNKDANDLKIFFENRGFDVVQHKDKKAHEILKILSDVQKENHNESSSFVCCVLTHGDFDELNKREVLYAEDQSYPTDKLFTPFLGDKCKSLAGKPKLFFIQACRGEKTDSGLLTFFKYFNIISHAQAAGKSTEKDFNRVPLVSFKIPIHSDFLIACSTVPGHLSWKTTKSSYKEGKTIGSWFIQSLCETLWEKAEKLDLLSILTIVNRKVAYCYESNSADPVTCEKKQVPSIYSTLTKQFRFPPKISNINKNMA